MTADVLIAQLAEIANEGLLHTNPVWSVDRLISKWRQREDSWVALSDLIARLLNGFERLGIHLPKIAIERWSSQYGSLGKFQECDFSGPTPGVVGLAVDVICQDALVVPSAVEPATEWSVDPTLPFRVPGTLRGLLLSTSHTQVPAPEGVRNAWHLRCETCLAGGAMDPRWMLQPTCGHPSRE